LLGADAVAAEVVVAAEVAELSVRALAVVVAVAVADRGDRAAFAKSQGACVPKWPRCSGCAMRPSKATGKRPRHRARAGAASFRPIAGAQ
jgi:hypothetical protein